MAIDILDINEVQPPIVFTGDVTDPYVGEVYHSPAQIVRQLLIDLGVGVRPSLSVGDDWPVFATGESDRPDECITVLDQAGNDDGRWMPSGESTQHFGIQVIVSSRTFPRGFPRAAIVRGKLTRTVDTVPIVQNTTVTVDGVDYVVVCVSRVSQVLSLGKGVPPNAMNRFSINMTVPLYRP